eukprot:TRINITY_DN4832_c0_g1_i1.p1 TRINITY_DN4832_c0_g1~~TRINITY_DN4832_c0_g1_i1.p1  ORF type:complete len:469 (-),score=47.87 TRINITY_DN4832_c0_g1_i1:419-1825(-)
MSESSHGDWCSTCVGCGGLIQDQFILRVSPDLSWHAACLKCCECQMTLDENHTCFVRDGKTFCKKDYIRLYGARCSACQTVFTKNDFVMRAKTKMFHLECFRCAACRRHLVPGDEFALHGDGIYCKDDHELFERCEDNNNIDTKTNQHIKNELDDFRDNMSDLGREDDSYREDGVSSVDIKSETDTLRPDSPEGPESLLNSKGSANDLNQEDRGKIKDSLSLGRSDLLEPKSELDEVRLKKRGMGPGKGRSNRGRTVLTEKQRTILTACFQHNPKPDALLKEQLVEMTGLNQRVIRVWFQNRRCKEHKRVKAEVLISRKDHQKLGYGAMNGIPMVATSPVRQDSPLGISPVDISGYHPHWKSLTDFALRSDIDHSSPHFNSLISQQFFQMHGYDPHYGPPPPPEMYPPHPDMPLMLPMPPFSQDGGPPGPGPMPNFHEGGLGPLHDGPPGEEFSAAFGDPDCQIESKG